jgi:hypothetical protein
VDVHHHALDMDIAVLMPSASVLRDGLDLIAPSVNAHHTQHGV